ncbi:MAG: glycerate kinase [Chthoniobacterales bacterium]
MRILIAPDKFKGSLTAAEAASAIEAGFRLVFPDLKAIRLPLADGGEGTSALFHQALGGELIETATTDALGRPITAEYTLLADRHEAVIDMSAASGLSRLTPSERDPAHTSTRGTGTLVRDAVDRGARHVLVGLGGSATNDAGAGFAAALGYRFLDAFGQGLDPVPSNFPAIDQIRPPSNPLDVRITALSDVTNPLLGPRGATHVFGPQKGAHDLAVLETSVAALADIAARDLGRDHRGTPGAGAAGGLGYGLLTFFDAEIRPGFDACTALFDVQRHVAESDLVVTAEGRLDPTTADGKGPGGIAQLARAAGKPVIAFAGHLDHHDVLGKMFDVCIPITPHPMNLETAMADAGILLSRAAERAARLLALSRAV